MKNLRERSSAESNFQGPEQRWQITDSRIPFTEALRWLVKAGLPLLVWVALASVVAFFVFWFLGTTMLKIGFDRAMEEMNSKPLFQPKR